MLAMNKLVRFINFGRAGKPPIEFVPLVSLLGVALVGATSFCVYSLVTKNDVMINHHSGIPPWEKTIDETKPKIINLHPMHKLDPEIRHLKDEINGLDT